MLYIVNLVRNSNNTQFNYYNRSQIFLQMRSQKGIIVVGMMFVFIDDIFSFQKEKIFYYLIFMILILKVVFYRQHLQLG